jgi:tetratricopeptide (TPR) repeat protein/predicted O-methyltransferase YrrM
MARHKVKRQATTKQHADALVNEGRLDEAIEEYRAAIALDESDPCSRFGLCDAYDKKGMADAAMRELKVAMRLRPGWPYYHNRMGRLLESAGRIGEAAREYAEAVRLKPDFGDALAGLRRVSGPATPGNLKTLINYRKLYDVVRLSAEIDLFSYLGQPVAPEDLAVRMGMDARFICYLLNVLARFGYVEMIETDDKACYMNTAVSRLYLSSDSPSCIGDEIFKDLETYDALRKYIDEGPRGDTITKDYWTPGLLKNIGAFALLGYVQETVEKADLSGRKKMLDIGGGHGLYSIFFTEKYPGLKAWVLDLPAVTAIARENIERYGAADRVSVIPGDFQDLKRGKKYDVVLISNVTASYDDLCALLSSASGLLCHGGMLVLRNFVSDMVNDDWSSLIVLDRYSRRGRQGFSTGQLRSAMEIGRLREIRVLHEGDGVAVLSGIKR